MSGRTAWAASTGRSEMASRSCEMRVQFHFGWPCGVASCGAWRAAGPAAVQAAQEQPRARRTGRPGPSLRPVPCSCNTFSPTTSSCRARLTSAAAASHTRVCLRAACVPSDAPRLRHRRHASTSASGMARASSGFGTASAVPGVCPIDSSPSFLQIHLGTRQCAGAAMCLRDDLHVRCSRML